MTQDIETFDAIIIGSGQAGNPLAGALAGKGLKTVLIEKDKIGGTCINTGCTPTKAMIASAQAAYTAQNSESLGVIAEKVRVDFQKVITRKDDIVETFRSSSEKELKEQDGLAIVYGQAYFINRKTVEVALNEGGKRTFRAKKIFIDTGSQTNVPDIEGIEEVDYLDNRTIMQLRELPEHLLIIGGGYIGLEFGQMFHRFGSKVSIFQHGEYIAEHEDDDVADELAKILQDEGIDIHFNSATESVSKSRESVTTSGSFSGKEQQHSGTHLLIATGRMPNTKTLQLDKTGVKTDEKGHIVVNNKLETNVEGIYALGDVKGGLQFTHVSYNDYKIVKQNLFGEGKATATTDERILTYTIFTDPQLGRAGFNEKQAKEKGIRYKVAKMPMEKVARGIETSHTKGFMKVLIDESNDKIIGASILSIEGGEIASALLIAMMGGLTYQQIRDGMFPHPTLSESLNNLFATL